MTIFLTGSNGYLGSYVAHELLRRDPNTRLALLVRAKSPAHAEQRLWQAWQLHMEFEPFIDLVRSRCDIYLGDLTAPELGLEASARDRLIKSMSSVLHVAASLNRKSSKACFNVNLRGTLSVIKLARAAADHHGLRRFSDISTTAVAGHRQSELVAEHDMIDWSRSDYDPYARTKKFCEHMIHELLPDVRCTVFRPSTVLGDSRFPETTQFDMTRAFVTLVKMPVLPLAADWRHDVVPADYVCDGIVTVHQSDAPAHDSYNLSAGDASPDYQTIIDTLVAAGLPRRRFAPWLAKPFELTVEGLMATPRGWGVSLPASLMKVFWPYLTFNTVFDNSRVVAALGGRRPAPFTDYAYGLFRFASEGNFTYPHKPWPEAVSPRKVA
ncbi:MAG: SDR family oxidoreductase [Myxococcales bacterium]|nr:SDR family oxidoreductase [Myxococcales bacterium]MCB9752547.1 SDR family oxidoreductase [Myxococcales bacterium]